MAKIRPTLSPQATNWLNALRNNLIAHLERELELRSNPKNEFAQVSAYAETRVRELQTLNFLLGDNS